MGHTNNQNTWYYIKSNNKTDIKPLNMIGHVTNSQSVIYPWSFIIQMFPLWSPESVSLHWCRTTIDHHSSWLHIAPFPLHTLFSLIRSWIWPVLLSRNFIRLGVEGELLCKWQRGLGSSSNTPRGLIWKTIWPCRALALTKISSAKKLFESIPNEGLMLRKWMVHA